MPDFDGVLNPPAGWNDVPQASDEMRLLGGAGGPLNAQAMALAARTELLKKVDPFSVEWFGASASKTNAENKAALQAAIASADGKSVKILIPPYINYGYKRTDRTTWPDVSGLSANINTRISIEDYSIGNSYAAPGRDGSQMIRWYFTGGQEDGSHDGNIELIRAGWHPAIMIMHDGDRDKMAAGAGVNRRASGFFGTEGRVNWRHGQGRITDNAATEDELAQYIISANGLPDLGVAGLTTCFIINKTDGAFGFNIGSPRFPFDFMSRVGQPSVGVASFETPTGEMTLRLAGVTNDLRIVAKPTSGFSVNDAASPLLDVEANGSRHTLRRNSAGNATLALKSLTKERRVLVRDDTGTLNIQNAAFSSNIVTVSDTELVTSLVIKPATPSNIDIATAALPFNNVFAAGTIGPSDARLKTELMPIDDLAMDAWGDVRIGIYQWLARILEKGQDVARWHFGVIAQQVRDAFLARGDVSGGTRYGLLCYDEWPDKYEPKLINEGATVTKTRTVTRPVMVTETHEILIDRELEDGTLVKVAVFEEAQVQKTVPVPVFEANGKPRLDDDGQQVYVYERVTEELIEEYQEPAEPEYTEVLVQEAGNRWGIREGQCLFLEAAYQRRRCDRIEARLKNLEGGNGV